MNLNSVRKNVERMMRKFPSQTAQLYRPVMDEYGQPTGERKRLGEVEFWAQPQLFSRWRVQDSGASYDDADAPRWICLMADATASKAQHEDILQLADGTEYAVKNIRNDAGIRIYLQIADRKVK